MPIVRIGYSRENTIAYWMRNHQLTTEEQGRCFKVLDEYSRRKHNCFVAEFFLSDQVGKYFVCFRPTGVSSDSVDDPDRYACKYLQFEVEDVKRMRSEESLPVEVAKRLDEALPTILER
jgi:hypothetical protein